VHAAQLIVAVPEDNSLSPRILQALSEQFLVTYRRHPSCGWADGSVLLKLVSRWRRDGAGQGLLEYVILGAFIAIIVLGGASRYGVAVSDWFLALAGLGDERSAQGGSEPGGGQPGGGGGGGNGRGGGRGSNCSGQGMASSNGKCGG
jgi:Flp pilus assembly pilin Flp